MLEFDIKGLFDNIDFELLMKTVRWHTKNRWLLLYIARWLKAPFQKDDGPLVERTKGTPQGGVVSPVLANLLLHYVFDLWMKRKYPALPFCRYADDGIVHCRTESEACALKKALEGRFRECKLELHPEKTRVVYCKNSNRGKDYPVVTFDFLGFTFRPRFVKNRQGTYFVGFVPGVSAQTGKQMRQQSRRWNLQLRSDLSLAELSKRFSPIIRGWINYYARFYRSALYPASPERAPGQVGNEKVQKVAVPSHQSGVMAGGNRQKATRAVSALAVWRTTDGWMMGAR